MHALNYTHSYENDELNTPTENEEEEEEEEHKRSVCVPEIFVSILAALWYSLLFRLHRNYEFLLYFLHLFLPNENGLFSQRTNTHYVFMWFALCYLL